MPRLRALVRNSDTRSSPFSVPARRFAALAAEADAGQAKKSWDSTMDSVVSRAYPAGRAQCRGGASRPANEPANYYAETRLAACAFGQAKSLAIQHKVRIDVFRIWDL